uniref:Pecanex-like protein n=1 Tax=Heterorhabditis bacteriophora TaxID=37862 RepID=A0A1I7WS82_HETBA
MFIPIFSSINDESSRLCLAELMNLRHAVKEDLKNFIAGERIMDEKNSLLSFLQDYDLQSTIASVTHRQPNNTSHVDLNNPTTYIPSLDISNVRKDDSVTRRQCSENYNSILYKEKDLLHLSQSTESVGSDYNVKNSPREVTDSSVESEEIEEVIKQSLRDSTVYSNIRNTNVNSYANNELPSSEKYGNIVIEDKPQTSAVKWKKLGFIPSIPVVPQNSTFVKLKEAEVQTTESHLDQKESQIDLRVLVVLLELVKQHGDHHQDDFNWKKSIFHPVKMLLSLELSPNSSSLQQSVPSNHTKNPSILGSSPMEEKCESFSDLIYIMIQIGILPSVAVFSYMTHVAHRELQFYLMVIYGIFTTLLFLSSTCYHICELRYRRSQTKAKLRYYLHLCDRAAIYLFIAASYTPWLTLRNCGYPGLNLKWMIWIFALLGILYKTLETVIYVSIAAFPSVAIFTMFVKLKIRYTINVNIIEDPYFTIKQCDFRLTVVDSSASCHTYAVYVTLLGPDRNNPVPDVDKHSIADDQTVFWTINTSKCIGIFRSINSCSGFF